MHSLLGQKPGMAVSDAPSGIGTAGVASVVARAVAPAGLNKHEPAPAARTTQSREQVELINSSSRSGESKALLTLPAMLARKPHILRRTYSSNGPARFYVPRWGSLCELWDTAEVRAFADHVGVSHA